MNTLTINQVKQNADLLFADYGKAPIVLKNDKNQTMLVMPFSLSNWNEIFLTLYQTFGELCTTKGEKEKPTEKKISAIDFFNKWHGFMKDVDLQDNWRDEYTDYLIEKHK